MLIYPETKMGPCQITGFTNETLVGTAFGVDYFDTSEVDRINT